MIKRLCDIFFSLAGIILLLPLFSIVALLVKLDSKGPVFFKQERIGQGFQPFSIVKFRTMVCNADIMGPLVTTAVDSRITRTGRFLRKTKIDELPQLINVLWGEMSFVGPRPEVSKYVQLFKDDYQDILLVKPGITDFAALEFSNEEEALKKYADPELGYIEEILPAKIVLYKKYIKERGFWNDLKLIVLTLTKICKS